MARDAAIVTTWGNPVAGREAKALEVLLEVQQFIGKHAAEGRCSEAEVWFNADGGEGMSLVKGKSDALMEIWESDDNQRLLTKVQLTVQDVRSHLYWGGDEELQKGTAIFAEVVGELGT
jgi:hypothetical protein